jgi:hypothetical protein
MMPNLNGTWLYESFRAGGSTSDADPTQIAAPWAPRGELDVATDATTGKVTGKLTFAPGINLTISGSVTPADANQPEGVELTGEGLSAVYKLRGFFISGTLGPLVVGAVVAIQNDLAKQPNGTRGPFILFLPFG